MKLNSLFLEADEKLEQLKREYLSNGNVEVGKRLYNQLVRTRQIDELDRIFPNMFSIIYHGDAYNVEGAGYPGYYGNSQDHPGPIGGIPIIVRIPTWEWDAAGKLLMDRLTDQDPGIIDNGHGYHRTDCLVCGNSKRKRQLGRVNYDCILCRIVHVAHTAFRVHIDSNNIVTPPVDWWVIYPFLAKEYGE